MARLVVVTMLTLLCSGSPARADDSATCDQDPRCYGRELAHALTNTQSVVVLPRVVEFEPGALRVYSRSREKIQAVAQRWQRRPDWSVITVHGYAGDSADLGQRRADKIRGYLIRYGVPPELVVAVGHTGGATVDLSIDLCRDPSCRRNTTASR